MNRYSTYIYKDGKFKKYIPYVIYLGPDLVGQSLEETVTNIYLQDSNANNLQDSNTNQLYYEGKIYLQNRKYEAYIGRV